MPEDLKVFSGNAHPSLVREICHYLKVSLSDAEVGTFSDGEVKVKINENVRGADAFIIQSTCPPVNDNLMELLILIDALRRASARRITAVIPYYGYARQDRKVMPRAPISSKLVANLISIAGASRILVMELHAGQIQGFFDIPVDHLYANPVFIEYFSRLKLKDLTVVSPDPGGVERARAYAKRLKADLAIIDKRRPRENEVEVLNVIGEVEDRDVIICDDIIDTGGTLVNAAQALKEKKARDIYLAITHAVLSGKAVELIDQAPVKELVITDTIPLGEKKSKKIKILSVAHLLGEAINRIHMEESVSSLFV